MKDQQKALEGHAVFEVIGRIADEIGVDVYVIGGFVRDYYLNRKDGKYDIDIVAVGSGIQLAQAVAARLGHEKGVSIYKNFGTAAFHYNNINLEFVGARKESYNRDSRKPIVENGTLEDDQKRRDFTINALAIGLNKKNYGQLLDPFNGLSDLDKKIIRTPLNPDITFSDDPLRMMRAVRFAAQLNFDIEPDTFEAISKNADRLKIVSLERMS